MINGVEHSITCSIGIAFYPEHGNSSEEARKSRR